LSFLAKAGFDLAPTERRRAMVHGHPDSELLRLREEQPRTKTELPVLITPHVIHDQRDARGSAEDLREQLPGAAAVPDRPTNLPSTGSSDPMLNLRRRLQLQ